MPLRIQTGHPVTADVQEIDAKSIRIVTDDDRCMFEVHLCKDGKSIEVRAVEMTKVNGVLFNNVLRICPQYNNQVVIRTEQYER